MGPNFIKRRNFLKKANYMDLTPYRILEHEINDKGNVVILIPRFERKFWQNLIRKTKSKYIYMNLDELGSATWLEIDGEKNVLQIVKILDEKLGEKIHPVQERTTKFLSILYNNKHIFFKELDRL